MKRKTREVSVEQDGEHLGALGESLVLFSSPQPSGVVHTLDPALAAW